jgi:DNA-binding MarR family transcriptional regulator
MADLKPNDFNEAKALNGSARDLRQKLHEALAALDDISSASVPVRVKPGNLDESGVLEILEARRRRAQFFPDGLFADPAWDILLQLYAAELGQRRMATSNLCAGAAVPSTTALRWIGVLEKQGMVRRHHDPLDGRRVYARLTDKALDAIEAYFARTPVPGAGVI